MDNLQNPAITFDQCVDDTKIWQYLKAYLSNPRDPFTAEYSACGVLGALESNVEKMGLVYKDFSNNSPKLPDQILLKNLNKRYISASHDCSLAGHILMAFIGIHRARQSVSQNRAIKFVEEQLSENNRTLKNAWSEYRNVSHIAAAIIIQKEAKNELFPRTIILEAMGLLAYLERHSLLKKENQWEPIRIRLIGRLNENYQPLLPALNVRGYETAKKFKSDSRTPKQKENRRKKRFRAR